MLLEVMDKALTVNQALAYGGVLTVGGYFGARWRWWLALPVLGALGVLAVAVIWELKDPSVGPAILDEAGHSYPYWIFGTFALATVATVAGAIRHWRARGPAHRRSQGSAV